MFVLHIFVVLQIKSFGLNVMRNIWESIVNFLTRNILKIIFSITPILVRHFTIDINFYWIACHQFHHSNFFKILSYLFIIFNDPLDKNCRKQRLIKSSSDWQIKIRKLLNFYKFCFASKTISMRNLGSWYFFRFSREKISKLIQIDQNWINQIHAIGKWVINIYCITFRCFLKLY